MKHGANQFVTVLAFIELIQNSSTFGLVIDVKIAIANGSFGLAVFRLLKSMV
jgi:hypothetical protein